MTESEALSLRPFRGPRYWPTWLLLIFLRGVARLPFAWQIRVGAALGRVLKLLKRRQRRIARRNLEVCFPELSATEREALLDRHFRSVGLSIVEMGIGWFSPMEKVRDLVEVRGREHVTAARAAGKGVLLIGAHFTAIEACAPLLMDVCGGSCSFMYRPQRNRMIDVMIRRGRSRFAGDQIARDNVRTLLRRLARNDVVVYFPDQTYLGNQSALLPFFGVPAVTNIATSKLARISGATVLSYFYRRKSDDSGYVMEIGPPFEGVPSEDAEADTRKFIERLERFIRVVPDQYLWLYKKFKSRPPPLPDIYA